MRASERVRREATATRASERTTMMDFIERIGSGAIAFWRALVELWNVYVATVAGCLRALSKRNRANRGELVRQLYAIGNRSLLFVAVTLGFLGMAMTYE